MKKQTKTYQTWSEALPRAIQAKKEAFLNAGVEFVITPLIFQDLCSKQSGFSNQPLKADGKEDTHLHRRKQAFALAGYAVFDNERFVLIEEYKDAFKQFMEFNVFWFNGCQRCTFYNYEDFCKSLGVEPVIDDCTDETDASEDYC